MVSRVSFVKIVYRIRHRPDLTKQKQGCDLYAMTKAEKTVHAAEKTRRETGKAPFGLPERLSRDAKGASLHCDKGRSGRPNGTSDTVTALAIQA